MAKETGVLAWGLRQRINGSLEHVVNDHPTLFSWRGNLFTAEHKWFSLWLLSLFLIVFIWA